MFLHETKSIRNLGKQNDNYPIGVEHSDEFLNYIPNYKLINYICM